MLENYEAYNTLGRCRVEFFYRFAAYWLLDAADRSAPPTSTITIYGPMGAKVVDTRMFYDLRTKPFNAVYTERDT